MVGGIVMRHQDYIDEIEFIGEFDGTYWNVWLDKTFWGVLPGEYCDILALWVRPEYKERAQVLLSTKDDSGQIFEDVSILPYSLRKQLINYLKN